MSEDTTAVMAAMFGEKNSTTAVGLGSLGRQSREAKYWKKPDGWVTIGPTRSTDGPEYLRYLENKRYKPLPDFYGVEVVGEKPGGGNSMCTANGKLQLRSFIKNGGLTAIDENGEYGPKGEYLLPRDQLIVLGMHRQPSIVAQRPDLADVEDVECPYGCIDQATQKHRLFAYQTWCDQHIVAVHKDAIASEAVGKTIAKAMANQGGTNAEQIAAIVAAVMQAMNPVQKAAVAAVAVEASLEDEPPLLPEEEAPLEVELPAPAPRFDLEHARRPDMMVFAKTMGIKTLPFSATAEDWRAYLKEQLALAS
jgi:hypothetical protein